MSRTGRAGAGRKQPEGTAGRLQRHYCLRFRNRFGLSCFPAFSGRTHNLVFGETVFNYAAVVLMYTTYCVNSARTSAVLVIPRPRTKGQKMDSRNLGATCRKQMRQEGRPGFGTNLIFVGVYTSTGLAVFFKIVSVQIPSAKKRMATPRHSFFRPYLTTALCM